MRILTADEFKRQKHTQALVIYGSGYSINDLSEDQKLRLQQFDSIGFNWFCKSKIHTSFYLIREQANTKKRRSAGETPNQLFSLMNSKSYKDTSLIVVNVHNEKWTPEMINRVLSYHQRLQHFEGRGVVLKEIRKGTPKSYTHTDIFQDGLIHGKTSLCSVLHWASWFKYKSIIFVGIDLYDSRYFWLGKNEKRHSVKKTVRSKHAVARHVLNLMEMFKRHHPHISLRTANKKSLLRPLMDGVWT